MDIDQGTRLVACPSSPLRANVPAPISERLDALVAMAEGAGAATSRGEMLAALILAAPESSDDLLQLWLDYRRAPAREAAVAGLDPSRVLRYEKHRPGRRPRAQSAS